MACTPCSGLKLVLGVVFAVILSSLSVREPWTGVQYVRSKVGLTMQGLMMLFAGSVGGLGRCSVGGQVGAV